MVTKRLRPGAVRDAIMTFMEGEGSSSVANIREAVEAALGHPVSASSVRSYLNLNVPKIFTRLERGTYKLKKR